MPRQNQGRTFASEAHLAERIAFERKLRNLGVDALAKLMTDAGCKITGSAILRIEKGNPRRRVTVDELMALAQVFETEPMDLLRPADLVEKEWAEGVAEELATARAHLVDSHAEVVRAVLRLVEVAGTSPDLYEFVTFQFRTATGGKKQWFAEFTDLDGKTVSRLAEITEAFWSSALDMGDALIEAAND